MILQNYFSENTFQRLILSHQILCFKSWPFISLPFKDYQGEVAFLLILLPFSRHNRVSLCLSSSPSRTTTANTTVSARPTSSHAHHRPPHSVLSPTKPLHVSSFPQSRKDAAQAKSESKAQAPIFKLRSPQISVLGKLLVFP